MTRRHALSALLLSLFALTPPSAAEPRPDVVVADFEAADYAGWKATGTAFGSAPARGTLPGQMPVTGFKGKGLVNSFLGGDRATGTLTSPEIVVSRKYLAFLIGGGKDAEKLSLSLLIDGKVVRTATGLNDRPGGSEFLATASWDVAEFAGKKAVLRIVDDATGGWGHINVDHVVLTDRKPPGVSANAKREFIAEKRYLHLPIRNGAKKRIVTLLVEGRAVVRNDVELADDKPDWWAPMDVSAWKGKKIAIVVDKLADDSKALSSVSEDNAIRDAETLYREPLRGQIHFSPRRGWNNDPNGMVFFNGEYHLFFQHNPYGWGWGNMHWGHAVSKDLVRWEELPDALMPDDLGPMFSGSAVVDHDNTSGFGKPGKPALVLIYTAAGRQSTQCLAYSLDGRTFTKYEKNPVVKQITGGNRDPKVMWHAPTKKWVMALYVELKGRHTFHFLTSPNLKDWTTASVLEGGTMGKDGYLFECPDFFELPVDGDAKKSKWVVLGANTEYAVGTFDGAKFTPEKTWLMGQRGRGFYAPQTFDNVPAKDGRRIQIGWFQTETKGMPFNQSMTIPLELKLASTDEGVRLTYAPVKELESLRAKTHEVGKLILKPGDANPLAKLSVDAAEIVAEFTPAADGVVRLDVRGTAVVYDAKKQELSVNGHKAPAPLVGGKQRLTVYVDRTGLEVFASGGRCYVPMPVNAKADARSLGLSVSGGAVVFESVTVYELRSAWGGR